MDDIKELTEIVRFIKDKMVVKEDLKPINDKLTAIEGKLNGIDNRIDREADRNYQQDIKIAELQKK